MTEKQTPREDDDFTKEAAKKSRRLTGLGVSVLAGASLVAGGLMIANDAKHPSDGTYGTESLEEAFGERQTTTTELKILDGATLRSGPDTTHDSLLKYEGEDLFVNTPEGVYTHSDENGKWFGFESSALPEELRAGSLTNEIAQDDDGIIWVNEQRATPITTVVGDVATDDPSDPAK